MGIWTNEIKIKDFLNEDSSPEHIKEVGNKIADVIEKAEFMGKFPREKIEAFRKAEEEICFNDLLDDLYNFCDYHRIWVC